MLSQSEGRLGVQVGHETFYIDELEIRQALRREPRPEDVLRAMARRLAADGVNPRTATFAQIKSSIESAALEV
jgi:hypothetical protein